jgi:hypothetical protein
MDVKGIIKEIDSLPAEAKVQIYSYIYSSLSKREQVLAVLEKYRGIGKGVWNEDAQDYINGLREDDRF